MVAENAAADRCHLHVSRDWQFTQSSLQFHKNIYTQTEKSWQHHTLSIIPYSHSIWQYAVRWLLALCSQFRSHRANAWLHIHPPPPCRANVASLPWRSHGVSACCSLLRLRRDLLSDLQTGSERGRAFTNSTISAVLRSDRFSPATAAPPPNRAAIGRGRKGARSPRTARPSDWLPPLAESRPQRLLRLDYGVSGVLMEPAVEMHHHDMTNTQHRVQRSWMKAVYELVKECKVGPARAKKKSNTLKTTWLQPVPLLTRLTSG